MLVRLTLLLTRFPDSNDFLDLLLLQMDACSGLLRHVRALVPLFFHHPTESNSSFRLIALNVKTEINCQALYNFNQFAGNSSLGASSTLLMLRSIAIWQRNRYVTIGFIVVGAGLWGILMHGVTTVRAHWDPVGNTCSVDAVTGIYLTLVYLYTMFTDLTVLIVTLAGLSWSPGRSGLWRMLWEQGIMFFLVAFVANLIPAIMLLINLNPIINIVRIPRPASPATSTYSRYY